MSGRVSPIPSRVAALSVLPIAAVLTVALMGVWISVRTGTETRRFSAFDLPVVGYVLIGVICMVVAGILVEGVLLRRWPLVVPAIGSTLIFIVAASMLLLEEVAAGMIPNSFLPVSVRRLTADVYGGLGTWLSAGTALLVVTSSRIEGGGIGLVRAVKHTLAAIPPRFLALVGVASAAVGLATWSRYQPWVAGSAGSGAIEVPGWSLPYVGPVSLVVVLLLGATAAVLFMRRSLTAALIFTAGGWAAAFLGALSISAASALALVDVDRFLPGGRADGGISVDAQWGAWMMFATGCVASACGLGIIAYLERDVG